MTLFVVQEDDSTLMLGRLHGEELEVLHRLWVPDVRTWDWSADRRHLGVLDERGKRLQLFHVDPEGAESEVAERVPSPVTLPKGSFGRCLVLHGTTVFVGGNSEKGPESLWTLRWSGGSGEISSVGLPDGIGRAGKAIDHLYIERDRLVAVDDLRLPKYVLSFRLAADGEVVPFDVEDLKVHSTYEHVVAGATGRTRVALYSEAINHGVQTAHLAVLDKRSRSEVALYSAVTFSLRRPEPKWTMPLREADPPPRHGLEDGPLESCPKMSFVDDVLLLGTDAGLFAADLAELVARPAFVPVALPLSGAVVGLSGLEGEGWVVSAGAGPDFEMVWVPLSQLRALTRGASS